MGVRRYVRGRAGLIAVMGPGIDLEAWRAAKRGGLEDYLGQHQLCVECGAQGVVMVGWSDPETSRDFEAVEELQLDQLPVYEVCSVCGGSGRQLFIAE